MALARPMMPMKVMPENHSPQIANTTVPPAKTTACPDVASARPMEASTSMPSASCRRCRVTTNSE